MTVIVSQKGEVLFSITADPETIELNTPDGCVVLQDPPIDNSYWLNGNWNEIPVQPHHKYIFSYDTYEWLDPRTIKQIQDNRWQEIKSLRDKIEFGGFEFEGNIYDSDLVSQGRIFGAMMSNNDQVWTLTDNSTTELKPNQLIQLYHTLQIHISNLHERSRIARQLIYGCTVKEQIESINL